MTETLSFQRARKPEEQKLRREAILAAAAELFDAEGPQGAGLNAIAARAGFTKSNVYRYFESREEVLMSLFLDEASAFVADFEVRIQNCAEGDIDALADTTLGFIERPRFGALLSIIASVLEQNVSVEKIMELKRGVRGLNGRIAKGLQSRLPGTTLEDCAWVASTLATLAAGMWPHTRPSRAAATVLALPEFADLKPVPERDLRRAFKALLASVVASR